MSLYPLHLWALQKHLWNNESKDNEALETREGQ